MARYAKMEIPQATEQAGQKQVVWMAGFPCAGKTFMGDYLATRGWHHIDGDQGGYSDDPTVKEKLMKQWAAMQRAVRNEPYTDDEWQPYYQYHIDNIKEALKTHDKVVLTYAVCGLFKGEKEMIFKNFPDVKLIKVSVNMDVLFQRFLERNDIILKQTGMTEADMWATKDLEQARKDYGEEYSKERLEKFQKNTFFHPSFIQVNAKDPNCFEIFNDDQENNTCIKSLNKIVGLDWQEPNIKAIQ